MDGGKAGHDDLIAFEVVTETIDPAWWKTYRKLLERVFEQAAF